MSENDVSGECRPQYLIQDKMDDGFYENIPTMTSGQARTNQEAGINPSRFNRNLGIKDKKDHHGEFQLKKTTLRSAIGDTRAACEAVQADGSKFLIDLYKRRKQK